MPSFYILTYNHQIKIIFFIFMHVKNYFWGGFLHKDFIFACFYVKLYATLNYEGWRMKILKYWLRLICTPFYLEQIKFLHEISASGYTYLMKGKILFHWQSVNCFSPFLANHLSIRHSQLLKTDNIFASLRIWRSYYGRFSSKTA